MYYLPKASKPKMGRTTRLRYVVNNRVNPNLNPEPLGRFTSGSGDQSVEA